MKDAFNIEHQWKLFLERVGLKEEKMPPDQIREMKRAFYGAWGQCLIVTRDEVSSLPEKKAINVLQRMITQVGNFWLVESQRQN